MKKIILISFLLFFITGCNNYRELNELAIVTGVGIDKIDGKYEVSLLVSNSKKEENSGGGTNTLVYSGKGKTISEAIQEIQLILPKEIYMGHLSIIIIEDKLAKKGISSIIDYFFRYPESANNCFVLLSKDKKAKDVLKILSPLENFSSQNIFFSVYYSSQLSSISNYVVYSDMLKDLMKPGININLSSIEIVGSDNKASKAENLEKSNQTNYTKISNIGIFKDYKLVDYLNENESVGLNVIKNLSKEFLIKTKCKDDYIVASITDSNSNIKIDNDLNVTISINGRGYINEVNCNIDLEKDKNIKDIETKTEKELKKMINETITKLQKNKTDVIGIGNLLYRTKNKLWEENKDNWHDLVFPNLNFEINVDLNLKTKGVSDQTLGEIKNGKR